MTGYRFWQVWWLGGAAAAALTGALVWAGEWAYAAGHPVLEALAGATRVMIYVAWFVAAWRCAGNVTNRLWTPLGRSALLLGLLATAVLW